MGRWEAARVPPLLGSTPRLWSRQPLGVPSEALRCPSWPNYYYPGFMINGRQCLLVFTWEGCLDIVKLVCELSAKGTLIV